MVVLSLAYSYCLEFLFVLTIRVGFVLLSPALCCPDVLLL